MKRAIVVIVTLGLAATSFAVELSPIFRMFFWYQHNMSDYPDWYALSDKKGDSSFEIGRLYVGADFETDYKIEGRFLFDVGRDSDKSYSIQTTTDDDGDVTGVTLTSSESKAPYRAFVKNAYIQYGPFPYLKFRGGMIPTAFSDEVTSAWGNRFVASGPYDGTTGWESSADLGVDVFGGYGKWIIYDLSFMNGNGYTKIEDDAGKALALMLKSYPINMVDVLDDLSLSLYARANTINFDDRNNTLDFAGLFNWKTEFDMGLGFNIGFLAGMRIHQQKRGYSSTYINLAKQFEEEYDTSYKYNDPTAGMIISSFGEFSYAFRGLSFDYGKVALFLRYDIFDPNNRQDFDTYDSYVRDYKNEAGFNPSVAREITGSQDEITLMILGVSYAYKKFKVAVDYQSTVYAEFVDSDDADNDLDVQKPADSYIYLHTDFSF